MSDYPSNLKRAKRPLVCKHCWEGIEPGEWFIFGRRGALHTSCAGKRGGKMVHQERA